MTAIDDLRAGFRRWDGGAMARAARSMIEAALEARLSDGDAEEVDWAFRELLESAEGHPNLSTSFEVADVRFILGVDPEWTERRLVALKLRFVIAAGQSEAFRARWGQLGFTGDPIRLRRDELEVPVPLKGEPGHGEQRRPSIHARPAVDIAACPTWAAGLAMASGTGSWLHRYRAGEHEAVWAEMTALGDAIRGEDVFGDAVDVALETMRRARTAIEQLHLRLVDQGYQFAYAHGGFVPPTGDEADLLADLEAQVGPLPLSLCAFCTVVGMVDFCDVHPGWQAPGEALLDPIVVAPAKWLLRYDEERWYRHRYQLEFSPDRYHKEDISGGPPYTLTAPCAHADDLVRHEDTQPTFVELIRRSLRFGGFPGWSRAAEADRPVALLAALTRDLPAL